MMEIINANYVLNVQDLIEAGHLATIKNKGFKSSLFLLLGFFLLVVLTWWRIKDPDFLVANDYFKELNAYKTTDDLIQEAILVSIGFILICGNTFPRYDFFARFSLSKKYQQNFVMRENKNILINEEGLTIKSESYRQSRTWKSCDRLVENKQVFLLFHSREKELIVIPKRIFNHESELDTFYSFAKNIHTN